MSITILKTIWNYTTQLETVFSLLAMMFAGYAAYRLRRQNRTLRELAKTAPKYENFSEQVQNYEGVQTLNPVALAVCLVPTTPSIKKDVETFLQSRDWGKMDIEELNLNGLNNEEDILTFHNSLREKRHLFDMQGRTEIHLFIQGPIMAGVLIGAMFDNWKPVKMYHKPHPSPPSIYEYWCPLVK